MQKNNISTSMFLVFMVSMLLVTSDIYGYIDPGTGSYLVQILIAAFLGASLGIKLFWKKIKLFFSRMFSRESPGKEE